MCRLFAVGSKKAVKLEKTFLEFTKLSRKHNDGWGLACFNKNNLSLVKEPIPAYKSKLPERSAGSVRGTVFIGHLRKASAGANKYTNTHPFILRVGEKEWVFCHNGSLYKKTQDISKKPFNAGIQGDTDSERFFAYVMEEMKKRGENKIKDILIEAREIVVPFQDYTIPNKNGGLSFLLTDGKSLYVHRKNRTLWYLEEKDKITICSEPISKGTWKEFEEDRLYVIRSGMFVD